MNQELKTVRWAANQLQVSPQTIRTWYHEGRLAGVQPGIRTIRIYKHSVEALLRS